MTYQAIVSIRARHCWRAMPCRMRHTPPLSAVSIRARHCWRAMPCACWCAWQALRFQSAPAIAGGRCQAEPSEGPRGGSFNPRPPLLAGDAPCPFLNTARWKVSIRARHCWRAMPRILRAARYALPVSIRARHCWRAMRRHAQPAAHRGPVSIRARHCWRAMHCSAASRSGSSVFQSAPAIAGGRCVIAGALLESRTRFNPRPPLLAGDAPGQRRPRARREVSIRARHCWRAMHRWHACHHTLMAFQSAPAIAGGRCLCESCHTSSFNGFNPRPPLLAGDAMRAAKPTRLLGGFNPRPPLLAGDAGAVADQGFSEIEFQSAPAIAGGRCERASGCPLVSVVSIRARHCWRAMRAAGHPHCLLFGFQSAPAIAGGRCAGRG